MKIGLILFAAFQSLWSIDAAVLSFRYIARLDLFWTFWICLGFSILILNLCYFLTAGLSRVLRNWFYLDSWLDQKQNSANSWIGWCHRNHYWGLFAAGTITHPLVGVAIQKFFQFKNGYWCLFFGAVAKVGIITGCLIIIEHFAK